MSYVPSCESDLFISYAHIDDESMFEGQQGWVEAFHRALDVRLRQLLGEPAEVWRDPELRGNDYFETVLKGKLAKTALLLSIVSPRYLKSDWCLREVEEFCRCAEHSGGLRLRDRARLLKVLKTDVPRDDLPPPMRPLLGYEFYELDATRRPREYRIPPTAGAESYQACLDRIEDLAYDIRTTLEALRCAGPGALVPEPVGPERTVYLAGCVSALRPQADLLRRELQQRGFTVLPAEAPPDTAAPYSGFVAEQLARSSLSVHLLGALYGATLEGDERSAVELQIDEAGRAARDGTLLRVLWLPEDGVAMEDRQRQYLDVVQREVAGEPNTELLQTGLENLKTYLLRKLAETARPQAAPRPATDPLLVYVVSDRGDAEFASALRRDLMAPGHEVKPSYFEGDERELREYHQENLVQCDAVVIVYGSANELWVQRKLSDLRKAFGLGRQRPFRAKAVVLGAPAAADKAQFRTQDAVVVDGTSRPLAEALAPFLAALASHP